MLNIDRIRGWLQSPLDMAFKCGLASPFCHCLARIPLGKLLPQIWFRSPAYVRQTFFRNYLPILKENGITIEGKDVVEVGVGATLGPGYLFRSQGAASYVGTDLFRFPGMSKRSARNEARMVRCLKAEGVPADDYCDINLSPVSISYRNGVSFVCADIADCDAVNRLGGAGSKDMLVSMAVLEHIPKELTAAAIKNMAELIRSGGIMMHGIDMRDHFNFHYPFNFYRYSEEQWYRLCNGDSMFYTNRLRQNDWIDLFSCNGMEVVCLWKREDQCRTPQEKMRPEFRDRQDRSVGGGKFLMRKTN